VSIQVTPIKPKIKSMAILMSPAKSGTSEWGWFFINSYHKNSSNSLLLISASPRLYRSGV
jgi:hypothetical protein